MRLEDVPARLRDLLVDEGADPSAPSGRAAWAAFQRFAAEPIDGIAPGSDLDRLLFEAGPTKYGPGPGHQPAVLVDFERQYTLLDEAGEHAGMRSVLCSFAFSPGALQGVRPAELWGTPGEDAAVWVAEVEATEWLALLDAEPLLVRVASGAI